MFSHNFNHDAVIYTINTNELLLQNCYFVTNVTAVEIHCTPNSHAQCTLRMTHCTLSLNTSDSATKMIAFWGITLYWVLWQTSFQTKNSAMLSSDSNFMNNIKNIAGGDRLLWSISETLYSSGKKNIL